MVLQLALAGKSVSNFYGMVMDEKPKMNSEVRIWDSKELFGGQKQVLIQHEGVRYRLILTRQGKLILNK